MSKHLAILSIAFGLFAAPALAAEKTVTLAVENMTCASCPITVRKSLSAVPGVEKVEVLFENKTATVTFDDAKADIAALIQATTNAGYPSAPKS